MRPVCYIIDVQTERLYLLTVFPLPTKEVRDHKVFNAPALHGLISLHKTSRLAFKVDGQPILNDLNAFIAKRDRNLKPEHKLHHQVTDRMLIASVTTDTGVTKTTGIAFRTQSFQG